MKIEVGKFYKARDGRKVRIYATDGGYEFEKIHGAYFDSVRWVSCNWRENGSKWHVEEIEQGLDIVSEWEEPVPQRYIKISSGADPKQISQIRKMWDKEFEYNPKVHRWNVIDIKEELQPENQIIGEINGYVFGRGPYVMEKPSDWPTRKERKENRRKHIDKYSKYPNWKPYTAIKKYVDCGPVNLIDAKDLQELIKKDAIVGAIARDRIDSIEKATRKPCDHKWRHYQGLLEEYDYCETCDEKKKA